MNREAAIAEKVVKSAQRTMTRQQLSDHISRTLGELQRDILRPAGLAITMLKSDNPENWAKAFEYLNEANAIHTFGKTPFTPIFINGVGDLEDAKI